MFELFLKLIGIKCRCRRTSWPRSDSKGGYFVFCTDCGAKYPYDWDMLEPSAYDLLRVPQSSFEFCHVPKR